jgi:cytochrome b involved in lipid metabolism
MASTEPSVITLDDLGKHNSKSDCWIAVHSKVWDITDFIDNHPGGAAGKELVLPDDNRSVLKLVD